VTTAPRRVHNPPNPWASAHVEWLGEPPSVALEVYEEDAKSIVSRNDSPDVGFEHGVNPYRGCQHACAYCYARPTHQYLDLGAGTDFETKVVVKRNAPELLARELASPRWRKGRAPLAFSGVTDCYQPLEASYELTRRCLEICHEFRHPIVVITKGALVRRDLQLLVKMSRHGGARVSLSIPFASDEDARRIEPFASAASTRFETLRRLSEAGVPVGVAIAPLIPGLNDWQVPEILERARAAGATSAFLVLLRLPAEVRPVFEERLRASYPDRAEKVLREMRGGALYRSGFGERMRGEGPRWEALLQLFRIQCRRLGLSHGSDSGAADPEPPAARQLDLFGHAGRRP